MRRNGDEAIGRVKEVVLEGEKASVDSEVFDDGDFYMQLLRDVVESRMLDLGEFWAGAFGREGRGFLY